MNRPDLNTLSKEVFEANNAKGFHDVEVSNETLLMLVITELSEAVEADRKGNRADVERMFSEIKERRSDINDLINGKILARPHVINEAKEELEIDTFKRFFEYRVKDTIEDELADAVIRLLDLAGLRGLEIDNDLRIFYDKKQTFCEDIFEIARDLLDITWDDLEHLIYECLSSIECLCTYLKIDLWQHVSLKLKYNQTRLIKHGKNY